MAELKKSGGPRFASFFHSIRFRLVLWFVLILGIVMTVFSGFIYWRQSQDLRSIALERLNVKLERLLAPLHEEEHELGQSQLTSPLTSQNTTNLDANPEEGEVLALQAADGSILQTSGALTVDQIQELPLPLPGWNGVLQVTVPPVPQVAKNQYLFANPAILRDGQIVGYILAGVPLDANNQLGRLLVSLILGNLFTLLIALSGGFWLADRAMRPVQTITQTARQIGETDLHKRLHLPGNDELSQLGNTFDEMLDRLQAASERQRQFTADASHELRTPLTIIDLETSRTLSAGRTAEEYQGALNTIQAENQYMIRLVNNLLALARMDAGQVSLKSEPVDLSELSLDVIERLGTLATTAGVTLTTEDIPELWVRGDRPTLIQMITNLVENGIKYSANVAAPQVRISGGKREVGGSWLAWLRVSDNGPGIPSEHQAHVFDRFYQVDAARQRIESIESGSNSQISSGTGLGLAIVHWIVQAHQGEIQVQSTTGQGTTFEVLIPLYNKES